MKTALPLVSLCLALLLGCADVSVTTEVGPDGSWARRLEFRMDASNPMGEKGDFSKTFDLPKGEGWAVKESVQDKKMVFTAEKTGKAGEAVASGLMVKSKKGVVVLSTEASVKQVGPGRFEYREVVQWKGKKSKDFVQPEPGHIAAVKAALPAGLADDAKAVEILQTAQKKAMRRLLGPNEPMIGQLLMHPRMGERKIKKILRDDLMVVLKEMFGDKLNDSQRAEVAVKIVDALEIDKTQDKAQSKSPGGSGDGEGKDDADFVPLTFVLKVPGKIVSANGEIDSVTGQVVWDFYAQSAELEDVVLTATFESKP